MIKITSVNSDNNTAVKTEINDNMYITVKKVKHDINGNPRYQLNLFENNINVTEKLKGTLGRYTKNGLTFQSHNLSNDVNFILSKLEVQKNETGRY